MVLAVDVAPAAVADLAGLPLDLPLQGADLPGQQSQALPGVGELQLRPPLKEGHAQLLLQLGDVPGEGLLGDIELAGRVGDVLLLRRRQKILQITKINKRILRIFPLFMLLCSLFTVRCSL